MDTNLNDEIGRLEQEQFERSLAESFAAIDSVQEQMSQPRGWCGNPRHTKSIHFKSDTCFAFYGDD